jgi:hypothetical protein
MRWLAWWVPEASAHEEDEAMETDQHVADEFAAPEVRERLRRAYRRLAAQAQQRAQQRAQMSASTPIDSATSGAEDQTPRVKKQPAYVQLRMF